MNIWIENDEIIEALKTKSAQNLINKKAIFCISKDFEHCVLLRKHAAWEISGEGWRDGNYPSKQGGDSRWILNFFYHNHQRQNGFWFKMFVPLNKNIVSLKSENEFFKIITDSMVLSLPYSSFEKLMWDVMSGEAEAEKEIEKKFNSLK